MSAAMYAQVALNWVRENGGVIAYSVGSGTFTMSCKAVAKVHLLVTRVVPADKLAEADGQVTAAATGMREAQPDQEAIMLLTATVGIATVLTTSSILGMTGVLPPPLRQGIDVTLYAIFSAIFGKVEGSIEGDATEGGSLRVTIKNAIRAIRAAGKASPAATLITAIASVAIGFFITTLASILICPIPVVSVLTKMVSDRVLLLTLAATVYTTVKSIITEQGVRSTSTWGIVRALTPLVKRRPPSDPPASV